MEIWILEEAYNIVKFHTEEFKGRNIFGALLGHKRGKVFIVEKALRVEEKFLMNEKKYFNKKEEIERLFNRKLVGYFYISKADFPRRWIKINTAGDILVRVDPEKDESISGYLFEFDENENKMEVKNVFIKIIKKQEEVIE